MSERLDVLLLRVAGSSIALQASHVARVLTIAELSKPPRMPHIMLGMLNLAGRSVPVLSAARILGAPEAAPALYAPIILLNADPPLSLLADEVLRMVRVLADDIFRLDDQPALDRAFCIDHAVVQILEPARLLLEHERARIAELRAIEVQRLQPEAADA